MNEQSPTCQKCPLREALPAPEGSDMSEIKYTCIQERRSATITNNDNITTLEQQRGAFSALRSAMYKTPCPPAEIKRLVEALQKEADPNRGSGFNTAGIEPSQANPANLHIADRVAAIDNFHHRTRGLRS